MKERVISLLSKEARGYTVSCGPFNIIFATTGAGLIGCGAIDVCALEKFNYPAVKMQKESGIKTIDDLLEADVVLVNSCAKECGVTEGMNGNEALEKL
ncbi:YunC family protein [Candidatus Omnitrophota bacterium]